MAYKFKPNKAVAKRFKVTKTGKLKRRHAMTSHLMSGRSSKTKRKLRRAALVHEGLARNLRQLIGVGRLHPRQTAARRALAAKAMQQSATVAETAPQ